MGCFACFAGLTNSSRASADAAREQKAEPTAGNASSTLLPPPPPVSVPPRPIEKKVVTPAADEHLRANLSNHYEANFICAPPTLRPLPIVVVTGFLGSGKTTLLQRLMSAKGNLRVAAVVHDLAQLNVDVEVLARSQEKKMRRADVATGATGDGAMVGLSGCACCPGFEGTLAQVVKNSLREGVDQGLLDYVCLETSGAADPRRLVALLEKRFGPTSRARLDRVVALVDADQFVGSGAGWDAPPEAQTWEGQVQRAQLECADVVVLNKIDLLDEAAIQVAKVRLQELCPQAKVLACSYGNVALVELLEVRDAASAGAGAISHEASAANYVVSEDLEPKRGPARAAKAPNVVARSGKLRLKAAFANPDHSDTCPVIEWFGEEPVSLSRLQVFLAEQLPQWSRWFRRGKGTLWVAEDSATRWEWQASGRLRYSAQRLHEGFGGASGYNGLVLIFGPGFPQEEAAKVRAALDTLLVPPPAFEAGAATRQRELLRQELLAGEPSFELVDEPPERTRSGSEVLRFRLTGRSRFSIPMSQDLRGPGYDVDVDGMNEELAALICMRQDGLFLGTGGGADPLTHRPCVSLLWPLRLTQDDDGSASLRLLQQVLAAARGEANTLLTRYFANVVSCQCGR